MTTRSAFLRGAGGGAITAIALGASLALVAPLAANAAPVVSQGTGRLINGSLLGNSLDPVIALQGATAINPDGRATVTNDTPLSLGAVNDSLSVTVPSGLNLHLVGTDGIIQLGAVGQYAEARPDGTSVAFSGTVTSAPSLLGINPTITGSNLGTPGADDAATINIGTAQLLGGPDLVHLSVAASALAASASATAGSDEHNPQYTIGDLDITLGGTLLGGTLNSLDTVIGPLISGVNALISTDIPDPLAGGTITVSLTDLLAAAGVSNINDLPPGTNLLTYLPEALVTQVTNTVNSLLDTLQTAIDRLGPPGALLNGTLNSTVRPAVTVILGGLGSALAGPIGTAVDALLQLDVNNQSTDASGAFTETALRVGIGQNGSIAALDIASATVGPNAGIDGVPVVNQDTALIGGGILLAVAGGAVWYALVRRRHAAAAQA